MTLKTKYILQQVGFWLLMFLYLTSSTWLSEHNKLFIVVYISYKVFLQFLFSVVLIKILIPYVLNENKKVLFILSSLLSIYLMQSMYGLFRIYVLLPNFPEIYQNRPPVLLRNYMLSFYGFVKNIMWVVFPSILLLAIQYYQNQKDVIALKEQKVASELNFLKHQLNPHFLFNTLNNLYVLALKKSDKTPEVIAKLSEILDYILYQTKDKYVPLEKELNLLENYIALEKLRYGKRVEVVFEKDISQSLKIAPLILLTFIENAFKHGISQELEKGIIKIKLRAESNSIIFDLRNTKSNFNMVEDGIDHKSIGMTNTIKQLNLLYPNAYTLDVKNEEKHYRLKLKITVNENV